MASLSAKFELMRSRARSWSWSLSGSLPALVLSLIALALPRALLPDGLPLVCTTLAWLFFAASCCDISARGRSGLQLGSALALVALVALAPLVWLSVGLSLGALALLLSRFARPLDSRISLGVGLACPALFYAAIFAAGADERTALKLAFRLNASPFELIGIGLGQVLLIALTVTLLLPTERAAPRSSVQLRSGLALAIFGVLALRLGFIASVASLRTDLMVWSEPPALVNLIKLKDGEVFYGPMQWANSYSYSPGLELTQYALLRPFQLELSLRAHRMLGLIWQLSSAVVLSRGLWPWLGEGLRQAFGRLGFPVLLAALSSVTLSSLLAPHLHPDHLLLFCFSGAVFLCLRPEAFRRADWALLLLLPIAGTAFKLTGAGIGLGLVLAAAFERRWPALGVLLVSGVLALLTVPLFDATLGAFSAYAIRLQASHPMQWWRIRSLPHSAPGLIFAVACGAWALSAWARPASANARAARRVLLLTFGFGLTSLLAFLKQGGRENSLMPLALGGIAALLVLLGDPTAAPFSASSMGSARALPVVLLWVALSSSWPATPVVGNARHTLVEGHDREVSFLRQLFAQGQQPLSQGTAAWIDAGRRDAPRDRLGSASELELGRRPELRESEARFVDQYDGLFLAARALTDNPFLQRLRSRLERAYRVVDARPGSGYVILMRRAVAAQNRNASPCATKAKTPAAVRQAGVWGACSR